MSENPSNGSAASHGRTALRSTFEFADNIKQHSFLIVVVGAIGFLYLRTFIRRTPLLMSGDGPIYFEHGLRILNGQLPFRDYFTYVMPGADLLYAAIFGLFGVHAWLAQAMVIALGASIAATLVWVSSQVLTGSSIFLPSILFLVLDFDVIKDATHHWYSTLIVLIAAGVLVPGKTPGRVASAGALCGLATLFTQSQGTFSLIAIVIYLFWTWDRRSSLLAQSALLILPFVVIVGGVLAYFSCRASFASVYFALVTFIFRNFRARPSHTPAAYFLNFPQQHGLKSVSRLIPYFFIHLLVPFSYIWLLFRLHRERETIARKTHNAMVLISFIGLALFAAVAQAASYHRLCMIAPPAVIATVWLVGGTSISSRISRRVLWTIGLAFLVAMPLHLQAHWRGYVNLPIGIVASVDPTEFEESQWFAQHTRAGESYIGVPSYNFAFSLENPTPVDYLIDTDYTTKDQVAAAIQGVIRNHTNTIVLVTLATAGGSTTSYPGKGNLAPFIEYVHTNYHLVKVFSNPADNHVSEVWQRE
jgi:hypothetical protein